MEKFALLNLLKAINSLNGAKPAENPPPPPQENVAREEQHKPPKEPNAKPQQELPNIMYETLMRHETVSNRVRNRK